MAPRVVRRTGLVLAAAATIAACAAAASSLGSHGSAAPRRLELLVLTQTRGFHHASIPWAVEALKRLAARDGRYRLSFLASAVQLAPALKRAAAVVFLLTSGELPLDRAGKQALVAFVRYGGGLIGFHSATDTFHHWPGFAALIGAEFSYHPVASTQHVIVEDHGNAATRRLPASFAIHEEFYVFKHDPRERVRVLARLDTGHRPGAAPDRPLVWCRSAGAGRVFYDALGHFPQTWQDSRQLALAGGGIAWALGLAAGGC